MGIFDKDDKTAKHQNSSTIISDGVIINGTISTTGSIFLNGKFEGDSTVNETFTIGNTGECIGDINCKNLVVSGIVDGIITAENIFILETGKVYGNIQYDRLEIEKHGVFEGHGKLNNSEFESKYNSITNSKKKLEDIVIDVKGKK